MLEGRAKPEIVPPPETKPPKKVTGELFWNSIVIDEMRKELIEILEILS